ncbi:MAG: UvrD-helicase domain-containing protein [Chloroflexaceae bacterium]|nr:UvrD-helicase domain-containing protein [Chloroflexaceae bacterium]
MQFTPAQQQAIDLDGHIVVTAGAGSGKTRVLVERYLRLLVTYADPDQASEPPPLLAITFTEKAAREMRERVRTAVEQRLRSAPPTERALWEYLRDAVEAARISTIHSFCTALLRAQPVETGLDPQFAVLDEVEASLLREASMDTALQAWLAQAAAEPVADPQVQAQFATLQAELSLSDLRTILREMLLRGDALRAVVATLPTAPEALRAEWQAAHATLRAEVWQTVQADPTWQDSTAQIAVLAPAAPATDRIGAQVQALAAWLATLTPQAVPDDWAALTDIDLRGGSAKQWPSKAPLDLSKAHLKALRELLKAEPILMAELDAELEQRAAQLTVALVQVYLRVLDTYRQHKIEQNALDFDDLEWRARAALTHPDVQRRWRRSLRAVLVDEFQDTNDAQRAIVYALTGLDEARPGTSDQPHNSQSQSDLPMLFVVGDGKQSIYRFRGADVSVFQQVQQQVQHIGGQPVSLNTSFRTHPPLLAWINGVMAQVLDRPRPLFDFEIPFEPLIAHRPSPAHPHCVELHLLDMPGASGDLRATEAALLAERLTALVAGEQGPIIHERGAWRLPTYGDVAILLQASTYFTVYEQALRAAGIPFLTTAGRGYYDRQEVQDLLHLLRVLNNPADELALVGVLRSPLFALDDNTIVRLRLSHPQSIWDALLHADLPDAPATLEHARTTLRELYALRGRLTVVELLRTALMRTGYLAVLSALPDGAQRCVNVEKLIEAIRRTDTADLRAYTEYLRQLLEAAPREGAAPLEAEGSVRLMTVHASKGLEFPMVVLPDLSRTNPPLRSVWLAHASYGLAVCLHDAAGELQKPQIWQRALAREQQMQHAEQERLFYVALTRASDYLILSGKALQPRGWLHLLGRGLGDANFATLPAGAYGAMQVWRWIE